MRRVAVGLLVLMLAGCGTSTAEQAAPPSPVSVSPSPSHSPTVAGNSPSVSAKMICADEARGDIQAALGAAPTKVSTPTWVDHVYACRYIYPTGVLALSVKEMSSADETTAYFNAMQAKHPGGGTIPGLGQGAYIAPNGSALVRKDFKVLWIDVSGMPAKFGNEPLSRADVAYRVAVVIMGCWTGA